MGNYKGKIITFLNSEAVRYVVVGGCTTLVNLVTFTILRRIFFINVDISNIISIILAILFAYVANKIVVFKSHCKAYKDLFNEFCKFVGARLITMVIEVGGVFLLYSIMNINDLVSKLLTQIIVLIANFIISKFFVFVGRDE